MNKDLSYSFDFELTNDNKKAIETLLKSDGVRKYVIKLENGEYLDLVEFKEYDRLNNILEELEKWLKEDLKEVYRDAGYRNNIINEVLDKLSELKEGK